MLIAIGAVLWLLCVPINLIHAAPFNAEQTGGNGEDEGSESLVMQPEHGLAASQRSSPEPSNGPLRPSLALIYPLKVESLLNPDAKRDKSSQVLPHESGQRLPTGLVSRNSGFERKKLTLHLINSPSDEKQQAIHLTNNRRITQRTSPKPPKLVPDEDDVSIFHNYYSGNIGGDNPGSFTNSNTNNQESSPHSLFQATRPPSFQALETETTTKPFERTADPSDEDTTILPEPVTTTSKKTMSNAMKAIGFSAIPTIGAAFMYGPQWISALLALAGRRKKRSLTETSDEYLEGFRQTMAKIAPFQTLGRAAQDSSADEVNPWLALLSGQKYSSGTRQQLNDRLSEWRAPNTSSSLFVTGRPQRFTVRTTTSTPRRTTSATSGSSPEQFTGRTTDGFNGQSTINDFNNRLSGESLVIQASNSSNKPSSDSFHVLPVSNSGDLDLVAGFVQSTLSKFVDSASELENEVFFLNTPSVSLDSAVTPASLSPPVVGQLISSALQIAANNASTNSRPTTATLGASTSGTRVTTNGAFTAGTTTAFPIVRQTSPATNSRIENYTARPFLPNPVRPLFFNNNNFNTVSNSPANIRKDNPVSSTTTLATTTAELSTEEVWTRPYVLYPDPTTTRKPIPAVFSINPTEIPNTLPPRTARPRPSTGWPTTLVPRTSTTNAPTSPTMPSEYWVKPYEIPNTLPPRTTRVRPSSTLWPVRATTQPSVESGNPGQLNIYYLQRNSSSSTSDTQIGSTLRPSSLITIQNFFNPMPIKTNMTTTYTSSTPQLVVPVNSSSSATIVSSSQDSTKPSTTTTPVNPSTTISSGIPTTPTPVTGGAALGTLTGLSLVSEVLTANQKLSNILDTVTSAPVPPTAQQTRPSTSIFPSSASLLTLKYNHSATTNQLPLTTTASVDLTENSTIYSSFYTLLNQISNQDQYTNNDATPSVTDKPVTTSKPHTPRPSPYSTTLSGTGLHIVNSATELIDLPFDSFNTGPSFSFNIEPNEGGESVEYLYLPNEDLSYESDVITLPQKPSTPTDDFVPVVEPVVAEAAAPEKPPAPVEDFVPVVEAVVAEESEPPTSTTTTTTTTTSTTTETPGFTIAPQYIFPGLSAFNHQKKPSANLASIVVEAETPQVAVSANAAQIAVDAPQVASSGSESLAGILVEHSVSAPQLSISPLANILNIQTNTPTQNQVSSFIPFVSSGSSSSSISVSTSSGSSAPSLYSTISNAALPATGFAVAAVAYGAAALAPFWLPFLLSKKRRRNSQGYKKKNGYSSGLYDNDWAASDAYNFANYYNSPDSNYDNQQVYYKLYDRRQRQSKRWRPRH